MSAASFDTLAAARELESAGMDRAQAEAVAGAIRNGQGELATKAGIERLDTRISTLQWVIGVHFAISLATLASVLAMAFR